jgi:anti-anti-sigma regulatory factor
MRPGTEDQHHWGQEFAVADATRVEDLGPGDHACLTFTDSEERLDLVAAFVREGLRGGQKVICVTDTTSEVALRGELTERGLPVEDAAGAGRMSVLTSGETFLAGGAFGTARMIGMMAGQITQARRDGFAGLWITSDMCWALRPVAGVEELMGYESQMTRLLSDGRATAVCQYDRQCFDTVTLAGVASNHTQALAAATYHHDALLRICRQYQPPGVRVSGEIDYRAVEPLTRALAEAVALDEHVTVNLAGLGFTDGSAAGALLQAAAGMRPGQRMTVRCQRHAAKVLRALGCDALPGVAMVVLDDD